MRDYISNLTNDELEWLCSEIPTYKYEEYFKASPIDSLKINKSENQGKHKLEKLVYITLKNKNLDFVKQFLNKNARSIVLGFSRQLSVYEQHYKNLNFDEAMARTLKLFHFGGRVSLYFKLAEKRIDVEYIDKINQLIRKLDMEKEKYPRFGVVPLSDDVEEKNRQSIYAVKSFIENTDIVTDVMVADGISCVKGLFNRIIRHDQDDWYTINAYLDYPAYEDMHIITSSLPLLRKAIINNNEIPKKQALNDLKNHNFINYCSNYLAFYSEKMSLEKQEENKCKNVSDDVFEINTQVNSMPNDILFSVISTNADLMERCKGLIMTDWQEEHRQQIEEANVVIQDITRQKEALSSEMTKIKNNIVSLTKTKERIEQEIHEKEKLAVDVQNNVETIIANAQKHTAEFIASMTFVNAAGTTPITASKDNGSGFTSGVTILTEQVEEYEEWKDMIDNLSDNLVEAGVCNQYSESFAVFLYSSYLNHFPLLLAGPNASEIVDAFSVSLFGKTAGTLECVRNYDRSIISAALASEDEIIKVVNPFASEWISSITQLSTYSGKYCIAVHPFAEDIAIEPKGIAHYFYPMLTEMLVSHAPECKFLSVCYSENYQDYQHIIPKGKKASILKDMHMSMMTYNRINDVMYNLHKMLDDNSIDYDVLYAILPYAYMTMQTDNLLDAVNNKKLAVSKDLSDELNRLYGDE